ncbi:MAG: IS630 family transposase [bacterium]
MARKAVPIKLGDEERVELEAILRKKKTEQRIAVRVRIVLFADEGFDNKEISARTGINEMTVGLWRRRYAKSGINGLRDLPRPGRSRVYSHEDRLKVIKEACNPPETTTHWSVRDLQKHIKKKYSINMSHMAIQRILSSVDLKPHRYEMWLNSADPDFEAKQAEIIGLYMNPPENALVLCVDERTGIQALGRPYSNKPMIPGKVEKIESNYIRYGTKSLIAALSVHEGKVLGRCYDRHTNKEFLDFLKKTYRRYLDREIHIIVDNLSVHKHKNVRDWLEKRKDKIKFHFTPTHASWLNQIELWFSILSRKVLKRGMFKSRDDLVQKIMEFIKKYNQEAKPFRWIYTGEPLRI